MTALELLNSNNIFNLLKTSKLKLNISWKNANQRYDLECKNCNAIYSDFIISNNFSVSKKPSNEIYQFLTCKNCGYSQNDNGEIYIRKLNTTFKGKEEFPNLEFKECIKYECKEAVFDDSLKELKCYKEFPDGKEIKLKEKIIYLNVTDSLIASKMNPYELDKRKKLIEFYKEAKGNIKLEYAKFNKGYSSDKKKNEKTIIEKNGSDYNSNLIKKMSLDSIVTLESGEVKCDNYAVESTNNTIKELNLMDKLSEGNFSVKDHRDGNTINISKTGNVIKLERNNCIKEIKYEEINLEEEEIIIDKEELKKEIDSIEEKMSLDEKKIINGFKNKTSGCYSEINIHHYLEEHFKKLGLNYKNNTSTITKDIEKIILYGIPDGLITNEKGKVTGIIEIKKRTKCIFSINDLCKRKYDLCQITLYKKLLGENEIDLYIVQCYNDEIKIDVVEESIQEKIYEEFKKEINKFTEEICRVK